MKKSGRYKTSFLIEAQFEPGSRGRVLKNKLGIKSKRKMELVEALAYERAWPDWSEDTTGITGSWHRIFAKST